MRTSSSTATESEMRAAATPSPASKIQATLQLAFQRSGSNVSTTSVVSDSGTPVRGARALQAEWETDWQRELEERLEPSKGGNLDRFNQQRKNVACLDLQGTCVFHIIARFCF